MTCSILKKEKMSKATKKNIDLNKNNERDENNEERSLTLCILQKFGLMRKAIDITIDLEDLEITLKIAKIMIRVIYQATLSN